MTSQKESLIRFLLVISSFILSLRLARVISYYLWTPAGIDLNQIYFFLGTQNGEQNWVHFFNLLFVPSIFFLWFKLSIFSHSYISSQNKIELRFFFWIIQSLACYPLIKALVLMWEWIIPISVFSILILYLMRLWVSKPKNTFFLNKSLFSSDQLNGYFLFLCLTLYYFWLFPGFSYSFEIDWYHESDILSPARDFLLGKIPFRDIFVAQGLIHNIIKPAFSMSLLGESVASVRFINALTHPLSFISLGLLAIAFFKKPITWILFLIFIPLSYKYFPDRHIFSCLSLLFLIKNVLPSTIKNNDTLRFGISGIFAGIQLLYSIEVGIFTCASILMHFFIIKVFFPHVDKKYSRSIPTGFSYFIAGVAIVSVPAILYLLFHNAFDDFLYVTSLRLFLHTEVEGIPYLIWGTINKVDPLSINFPSPLQAKAFLWYIPLFIQYGIIGLTIINRKIWSPHLIREGILLSVVSVFFFYPALAHRDFEHLGFSIPYTIMAGFWMLENAVISLKIDFSKKLKNHLDGYIHAILILSILLVSLLYSYRTFSLGSWFMTRSIFSVTNFKTLFNTDYIFSDRLAGVNLTSQQKEIIQQLTTNTSPDEKILNLTTKGTFNFLSGRTTLSRYYLPDYIYTDQIENEILEELKENMSSTILTERDFKGFRTRSGNEIDRLKNYIVSEYKVIWEDDSFSIWTRI